MSAWTWRQRAVLAGAAVALVGCLEDGTGPGNSGFVQVKLTDSPAEVIGSAEVWISKVDLAAGGPDKPVTLFEDAANPRHYDLLDLRNGVTADLTEPVQVESGVYHQLRLLVDSARVTLAEGFTFDDGATSRTLFVPSGSESGIKVKLAEPIDAKAGQLTVILVDFDVERNFVVQGNANTKAGIKGILFTPLLVEKSRAEEAAP